MRTGKYMFIMAHTQRRWFKPPTPVRVLMVEVEEPVDAAGCRSTFWRPADAADAFTYENKLEKAQVELELLKGQLKRYQDRLDAIQEMACIA